MAISSDKLELLMKDKSAQALHLILDTLGEKYGLEKKDILDILSPSVAGDGVPLQAFSASKLSSLEVIVKYLKENRNRRYSEIAKLINRDDRTIWATYYNSQRKHPSRFKHLESAQLIPLDIFVSREKSVLGSLVTYLKDNLGYTFSQIAAILDKDYQTIYTSYKRGEPR